VLGILVGLVGVVVIVQPSPEALTAGSTVGQMLVLAAAASVALGSVVLQRVEPTLDSIPMTTWAMFGGALLLHASSLALGESPDGSVLTPTVIAAVGVVGVFSTAVGYPIFFALIRRIGSVRANLVAYSVPIFAAITGWVLFGVGVNPTTALGFVVVVAGVSLLERRVVAAELRRALD
jgi:drug/metabolite transporter (DMT)-like permease